MSTKGKDDTTIDFQSAAEVFYFANSHLFLRSATESSLSEMTLVGFMSTVKKWWIYSKGNCYFMVNFIVRIPEADKMEIIVQNKITILKRNVLSKI